nr:MAG TPA: hypothetical protein [Caudoviricetes sp.]
MPCNTLAAADGLEYATLQANFIKEQHYETFKTHFEHSATL